MKSRVSSSSSLILMLHIWMFIQNSEMSKETLNNKSFKSLEAILIYVYMLCVYVCKSLHKCLEMSNMKTTNQ